MGRIRRRNLLLGALLAPFAKLLRRPGRAQTPCQAPIVVVDKKDLVQPRSDGFLRKGTPVWYSRKEDRLMAFGSDGWFEIPRTDYKPRSAFRVKL